MAVAPASPAAAPSAPLRGRRRVGDSGSGGVAPGTMTCRRRRRRGAGGHGGTPVPRLLAAKLPVPFAVDGVSRWCTPSSQADGFVFDDEMRPACHVPDDRPFLRGRPRRTGPRRRSHSSISGRSQSVGRPAPRLTAGRGISGYRCWYPLTLLRCERPRSSATPWASMRSSVLTIGGTRKNYLLLLTSSQRPYRLLG